LIDLSQKLQSSLWGAGHAMYVAVGRLLNFDKVGCRAAG
jgi:hypothetical protein